MNQARIWLVVKPTVGLPLFLGTVALIALLVHAAVLNNTTWFGSYWNGHAKAPAAAEAPPAPVAEAPVAAAAPAPAPAATTDELPVGRVFFEVGKSDKWTDGGESIAAVAAYVKAHDGAKVAISGYHDPSGNKEQNEKLAKERAFIVRDALTAAGVAADRIALEKPVETTGTGDPRDARRVEATIKP